MREDFCKKVQWHRYINYERHFQARALIKELPAAPIAVLAEMINHLAPFPLLNMLGDVGPTWLPPITWATLVTSCSVDIAHLFNPYYLSSDGWQGFQILWQNLPEPCEADKFPCPNPDLTAPPMIYREKDLARFLMLPRTLKILLIDDPFGPRAAESPITPAPAIAHSSGDNLGIST